MLGLSVMPNNGMTSEMKDQTQAKTESIKDQVRGLVDAGQHKLHEAKDKLADAKTKVVDKADSVMTTLEDRIKARPLAAVGLAFGIGYVAMRIFRR